MELIKRSPNSNLYKLPGNKLKLLLGGSNVNVKDINGNLNPLDNNIIPSLSNAHNFKTKNNCIDIQYGDKPNNNRYLRELKLLTGESVTITLKDLVITPGIIKKNNTIEWTSGRLKFSTYSTEKHVKETIKQPARQVIVYQYKLSGLYPVVKNNVVSFYAINDDRHAFTIERPHYVLENSIQSFDYGWQDVGGNVYELTLPAPMVDSIVDPTISFGEATGADNSGDHKDTYVKTGASSDQAFGAQTKMDVRNNIDEIGLMRFSLTGHIPPTAITVSCTLDIFNNHSPSKNNSISIREIITDWGVDKTNEGSTRNPATGNQPTLDKSFQTGSGAGTDWATGIFSTSDFSATVSGSFTVLNGDPVGTKYSPIIANTLIDKWIANDSDNLGFTLLCLTNFTQSGFKSQEHATVADRPLLTVIYTDTSWFDTNFLNRRVITIDSSKVGGTGDLTDFPVLLTEANFDTTNFFSKVKSDGSDIVLTQDDGTTKLKRELISIDTTAKTLQLRVKVPTVKGSTPDTFIYIYYNNSAASETNDTATWEPNYQAVYHLEEDDTGTNIKDSTSNARDGTKKANAEPSQTDSVIQKGQNFDNVDDNINTNFSNSFTQISFSGFIKIASFSGSIDGRVIDKTDGGNESSFKIKDDGAGNERLNWFQDFDGTDGSWDTPNGSLVAATQYHIAITYDNSNVANDPIIYIDGIAQTLTEVNTPIGTRVTTIGNYILGNRGAGDRPANAIIDELLMYNGILTSDWINTEINNQQTPSTFYSVGDEEDQGITSFINWGLNNYW